MKKFIFVLLLLLFIFLQVDVKAKSKHGLGRLFLIDSDTGKKVYVPYIYVIWSGSKHLEIKGNTISVLGKWNAGIIGLSIKLRNTYKLKSFYIKISSYEGSFRFGKVLKISTSRGDGDKPITIFPIEKYQSFNDKEFLSFIEKGAIIPYVIQNESKFRKIDFAFYLSESEKTDLKLDFFINKRPNEMKKK